MDTIEVSFQVCGKFTRGQSGPFLDADMVYEEQRQICSDDEASGGLAVLYYIKLVREFCCWSNPNSLTSLVPPFGAGQPGKAQPGCQSYASVVGSIAGGPSDGALGASSEDVFPAPPARFCFR